MKLVQILTISKQIAFNSWASVKASMGVNPTLLPTVFLCLLQSKLHNIITLCSRENLSLGIHTMWLATCILQPYGATHFLVHTSTNWTQNLSFFALLFSHTHKRESSSQWMPKA